MTGETLTYVLFVIGFVVLIKGADWLVEGASVIAARCNISPFVIGLTVVAFGTSLPELIVNIIASSRDASEIAIGNILGSNIANILLILGVAAIVAPLTIRSNTIWKEIPLSTMTVFVVGVMASDNLSDPLNVIAGDNPSELSRGDGIVLLCFFAVFMFYIVSIASLSPEEVVEEIPEMSIQKAILFSIIGIVGVGFGGQWIVDGAMQLSSTLGFSESFVGLTILALGTSLPELATSVVAAYRGKTDITVGNVVGSNIFNICWVLGLSAVIRPLPFHPSNLPDIGCALGASLLLFVFMFVGKRKIMGRWEGAFCLVCYAAYLYYTFLRG